jgi:hypothetical protein
MLVALLVLPVALFLMAAGIMNDPWLIVVPYAFVWLAWPRKRRSGR